MSIILISTPSFSYVTDSSQCDNDVLSTYDGSANLTANWQGNPISVTWYNGDTQYDSNQCTYGGNLTMPSNIPTREGYTFRGWRARQAACSLSSLDTSISGTWYASKGSTGYCYYYNNDTDDEVDGDCSDSHFAGLNNSEWETNFSYGTVKGMAKCSGLSGGNNNRTWSDPSRATESELTSASGEKKYCWCAATSYTPDGGNQCNIASPSWVFYNGHGSASGCAGNCASHCAGGVQSFADFRRAVFGVSQ